MAGPQLNVGSRITAVMDHKGVTVPNLVEALATRDVQVSERTIRRIRGGGTISAHVLVHIAEILGVALAELLTDPESPDWRLLRWVAGLDAASSTMHQALHVLRQVDYLSRRYRQEMDSAERADDPETSDRHLSAAGEVLAELDNLRMEAEHEFGQAKNLIPADIYPAYIASVKRHARVTYVWDAPGADGWADATMIGRDGSEKSVRLHVETMRVAPRSEQGDR